MQINLNWDSSVSAAPADFKAAMQTAADILGKQLLDPITVTINVGWGETAGSPIGNALATGGPDTYVPCTYEQLVAALTKQATANGTPSLVANLPATDPTGGTGYWMVSQAQAKIFHLPNPNATATDGSTGYSTSLPWGADPNHLGATQYDLVSTALHEITHALGRINFPTDNGYDALNLYTYAQQGALQLSAKPPAYFSIDGGATNLNNLDMSVGGDSADWATGQTDSFGAGPAGVPGPMSIADWQSMEALGFKVAPTYILFGSTSVNEGAHDYLKLSTLNVPAGTSVDYAISGLGASQLTSGSSSGKVTVGSDGTAIIDLGIAGNAQISAPTQATVTLGNGLASYVVTVNNAADNVLNFSPSSILLATTAANDAISGTAHDMVSYNGVQTDYIVTSAGNNTLQVFDPTPGHDGTDTLSGIGRIQFSDASVAYDLSPTQSAGQTVELLGAAFGSGSLSNKAYVGIGLKLFDAGYSMEQVAQLALGTGAVSAPDNTSFVKAVWHNVVGTDIDPTNLASFTQLLDSGQYTQASLLAFAAASSVNQGHVGLTGLASSGIDFTPAA